MVAGLAWSATSLRTFARLLLFGFIFIFSKILIEFFNYIVFHTMILLGEHVSEVVLVAGKWSALQR